jgi:predicted ABC-type ATPase
MGAVDARVDLAERPELRDARAGASLDQRLRQLPDGHPSSPHYAESGRRIDGGRDDGRRVEADRIRPLTDAEHADHVADVKVRLADARAAGVATEFQHTIDPDHEFWSSDREVAHDSILSNQYAVASSVPCDHKAIVAGGLAGAGKTTVLREHAGIDLSQYLMINPDDIKKEMAVRGLIPEVDGLTPMEAADLVHEESSHIAKRLARMAQAEGKNVIWDVTMSHPSSAEKRIGSLRAGGYNEVCVVFVDISIEASVRRADGRYREGHEAYRAGIGVGGRFVPEEMTRAQTDVTWGSRNRSNFERVKHLCDSWSIYDNSVDGCAPVLAASHARADDATRRVPE